MIYIYIYVCIHIRNYISIYDMGFLSDVHPGGGAWLGCRSLALATPHGGGSRCVVPVGGGGVEIRLPKGNSTSDGARLVHQTISMIK